MKKIALVLLVNSLLFIMIFSLGSCNVVLKNDNAENTENNLSVLSWNVQALFDGEDQGNEYEDYRVSKGWTEEKYQARLNNLAKGITAISETPDILAFIEIENAEILEDVISSALAKGGYRHTFFVRNPGGALGIGIISRYPFSMTKSHSIISDGEINPRPMAEFHVNVDDQPFVFFACHWKSKLGDPLITEAQRKASARLALRRIKELEEENPGIPIIVLGDLNENHDEFYRIGQSFITALMPDNLEAANLIEQIFGSNAESISAIQDFFVITGEKTQKAAHLDYLHNLFYSPWGNELQDGSYVYKDKWETIDHFLLRPSLYDGLGWDLESCNTVKIPPFATEEGIPFVYNPRTGKGTSDHLPLLITFSINKE